MWRACLPEGSQARGETKALSDAEPPATLPALRGTVTAAEKQATGARQIRLGSALRRLLAVDVTHRTGHCKLPRTTKSPAESASR